MIGDDLRALSVRQPHASAIVLGHKDVENRSWRFPLPLGTTIAIHASLTLDKRGLRVPLDPPAFRPAGLLPRGAVIGLVDVIECLNDSSLSPWAVPGHWHWALANARALDNPITCKGALRLFRLPSEIVAALVASRQINP